MCPGCPKRDRHPSCNLNAPEGGGHAMKSTLALVGIAVISCTAWAGAQAPSQPPPTPPAGQAPRAGGQASPPPVGQTSTPPAGKTSAQPVGGHSNKSADASFIKKAAVGGMAEVDLGTARKLEGERRQSEIVRSEDGDGSRQSQRRAEEAGGLETDRACRQRSTASIRQLMRAWTNCRAVRSTVHMSRTCSLTTRKTSPNSCISRTRPPIPT